MSIGDVGVYGRYRVSIGDVVGLRGMLGVYGRCMVSMGDVAFLWEM